MSEDYNEWDVFGSDGEDEEDEQNGTLLQHTNHDADANDNSLEDSSVTITSHAISIDKAIDELCLFTAKDFITSSRSIPLTERYFGIPISSRRQSDSKATMVNDVLIQCWFDLLTKKLNQRGIQIVQSLSDHNDNEKKYTCDGGSLFRVFPQEEHYFQSTTFSTDKHRDDESFLRQQIVPGGFLLLTMFIQSQVSNKFVIDNDDNNYDVKKLISEWKLKNGQNIFSDDVWDIDHASLISQVVEDNVNDNYVVLTIHLTKRPCTVNTLACPWKTNTKYVPSSHYDKLDNKPSKQYGQSSSQHLETWLQYERRILSEVTVSPSISERKNQENNSDTLMLTKENIKKAIDAMEKHGFVILPALFSSEKHIKSIRLWSKAIMSDFQLACSILKTSKDHNVDIFNPGKDDTFDPISYKEMAMREDLRVDLRDGPCIKTLRNEIKPVEDVSLKENSFYCVNGHDDNGDGTKPTIIDSHIISRLMSKSMNNQYKQTEQQQKQQQNHEFEMKSLRYNPNILEIIRSVLNPGHNLNNLNNSPNQNIPIYKGNFGRYNFDGKGPDGSPQSLRVGQIGAVISLPQAGDQAIHADTPHIFEIYDCLPCHYANLFILGDDDNGNDSNSSDDIKNSKEITAKHDWDGNVTGDNLVGGTAFVHGSHRLSITAELTAGDDDESDNPNLHYGGNNDNILSGSAAIREKSRDELHMRIIRPSMVLGDALIFDTRVLHFGLANRSKTKCRPMLYVNMTHSWFNDPKNWDDKMMIFSN